MKKDIILYFTPPASEHDRILIYQLFNYAEDAMAKYWSYDCI